LSTNEPSRFSRESFLILPHGIVLNDLDQLWVADDTYLHLAEEFRYLAVILDVKIYCRSRLAFRQFDHMYVVPFE
jgi:hypothetical protein